MLTQQVVTSRVRINAKNQVRYFQIRLPRNAKRIVGVETGVKIKSACSLVVLPETEIASLDFVASRLMGNLRLQHVGKSGLFYASAVYEMDNHSCFCDYTNFGFPASVFTHGNPMEADLVIADRQAPLILGMFQDDCPVGLMNPILYDVLVHLWYEPDPELP